MQILLNKINKKWSCDFNTFIIIYKYKKYGEISTPPLTSNHVKGLRS